MTAREKGCQTCADRLCCEDPTNVADVPVQLRMRRNTVTFPPQSQLRKKYTLYCISEYTRITNDEDASSCSGAFQKEVTGITKTAFSECNLLT